MATAQDLLNVARGQIGYSRWNDPQAGTKYGRRYAERTGNAYFGQSGVPFCAMFVTWCLEQVGMQPPGGIFAYCPSGISQARNAGALVSKTSARPGDIVFFDWGRDGLSDHVGFVEANNGASLTTIEGNTLGGKVARRSRAFSVVCAVARPAYDSASAAASSSSLLAVDGYWGPATTRALQQINGTPVDGVVSGQVHKPEACPAWRLGRGGSLLVRAMQGTFGVTQDGYFGPDTTRAAQRYYGTPVDGVISPGGRSSLIRAMQSAINQQLG